MKRRDFLKLIGVATLAPSVLVAKRRSISPKPEWPLGTRKLVYNGRDKGYSTLVYMKATNNPVGVAVEYIPKGKFGWVWIGGCFPTGYSIEEGEPK